MKEDTSKYDCIKLENQLCFPLYVCSKEIVRRYKPYLDEIGLTYTQYITMMAMWEHRSLNVKHLGEYLYLDSGTLTPVLKTLEQKGYVKRERSLADERNLTVSITEEGEDLKEKAVTIPAKMCKCTSLNPDEMQQLCSILHKMIRNF